jgi:hypothetical protein
MRRVFSGLVLISLVTCSSCFAADVSNVDPAGSQKVQKPSPAARAEHSASLPISSAPKSTAPATNSWTGFYVGAGAGAAQP